MSDYQGQMISSFLHAGLMAYLVYFALPPKPLPSGHGLTVELIKGQTPKGNTFKAPQVKEKLVEKKKQKKPIIIAKVKPVKKKPKVTKKKKLPVAKKPTVKKKVLTQKQESFHKIKFARKKAQPKKDVALEAVKEVKPEKVKARVAKVDTVQQGVATKKKTSLAEAMGTPNGVRDARQIQQVPGNLPPSYPVDDRLKRREGRVILVAYVNKDGLVEDVQVESSTGSYAMNQESIRAFYKYKFIKNQPGWVRMPYEFQLVGPAQQYGSM